MIKPEFGTAAEFEFQSRMSHKEWVHWQAVRRAIDVFCPTAAAMAICLGMIFKATLLEGKYFWEGIAVWVCLTITIAYCLAMPVYLGYYWYLNRAVRQLEKDYQAGMTTGTCKLLLYRYTSDSSTTVRFPDQPLGDPPL